MNHPNIVKLYGSCHNPVSPLDCASLTVSCRLAESAGAGSPLRTTTEGLQVLLYPAGVSINQSFWQQKVYLTPQTRGLWFGFSTCRYMKNVVFTYVSWTGLPTWLRPHIQPGEGLSDGAAGVVSVSLLLSLLLRYAWSWSTLKVAHCITVRMLVHFQLCHFCPCALLLRPF